MGCSHLTEDDIYGLSPICHQADGSNLPNKRNCIKGYLFDENLPANVTFQSSLPIYHVSSLGKSPTDSQIWEYAKVNNLIIVTKHADFSERLMIDESPAKVIHLRFGNMRKKDFHQFLAKIWPEVENLIMDYQLINVYVNHVEAFK